MTVKYKMCSLKLFRSPKDYSFISGDEKDGKNFSSQLGRRLWALNSEVENRHSASVLVLSCPPCFTLSSKLRNSGGGFHTGRLSPCGKWMWEIGGKQA